jgi:TPP-dependent pyruvate/acetoin dehydrogenase alpha subunit
MQNTELMSIYSKAYLARRAEEKIGEDYFKDEMKTPVHLGIGAEAIATGVLHCVPVGTQVFGTYRNHNIYLTLSDDLEGFFGELLGRVSGCARGKAGSMHMSHPESGLILTSAVVGTTIPVAVGSALAGKYTKKNWVSVVFFGDGAVEEGVFYESLNFAALKKLPVLFVCEDNGLAIHTPIGDRKGYRSLESVVTGTGCNYLRGDGTDIETVVEKTRQGLSSLKEGPTLLHFDYFRFLQHVGPLEDFEAGYRQKPENLVEKFDPIWKLRKKLIANGTPEKDILQLEENINSRIQSALNTARKAPFPEPSELLSHVWA